MRAGRLWRTPHVAQHGWALEVELVDTSIAERRHGVTEQCVRSVRVRFRVQLNVRLVRCPWTVEAGAVR